MGKGIGAASDYYRLRVLRVDESDEPDLEWREDILWRRPPAQHVEEYELFKVEVVALDDEDEVTVIGAFESGEDANEALTIADEDLGELTRAEFEARYFPADT
jgi:hypothetical protein